MLVPLLILISAVALLGAVLYLTRQAPAEGPIEAPTLPEEECCGAHEVCEKELTMKSAVEPIVYFDDEELDALAGLDPDAYTPEQVAQVEEVLFTLNPTEVSHWVHSLQQRSIAIPTVLRDEVILLLSR